uniref:Uncharacterized protein n=1 Tax=Parascaris univalens TaxID=6257 RepID=A0A915A5E9_PARUN
MKHSREGFWQHILPVHVRDGRAECERDGIYHSVSQKGGCLTLLIAK